MNLAANDLLARVDKWKFKLHEKLAAMTTSQRAAFWEKALARAVELGLPVKGRHDRPERAPRRLHRSTG